MKQPVKNNLEELDQLLAQLEPAAYSQKLDLLSGASVGQHLRHILDLYGCLFAGMESGTVSYDQRRRDLRLETDLAFARQTICNLSSCIDAIKADKDLVLLSDFSSGEKNPSVIRTSLFRELAYNLEHSIHHQALIKIGLHYLSVSVQLDENFGVAPATIRYRKNVCVQ